MHRHQNCLNLLDLQDFQIGFGHLLITTLPCTKERDGRKEKRKKHRRKVEEKRRKTGFKDQRRKKRDEERK